MVTIITRTAPRHYAGQKLPGTITKKSITSSYDGSFSNAFCAYE
jgi:hypothetical protein